MLGCYAYMRLLTLLVHLLYPPACLICRTRVTAPAPAALLCARCLQQARRCAPPLCARCGLPLAGAYDAALACRPCRQHPPAFDAAWAPWQYTGAIRAGLKQLKYHHRHRLGAWFAEDMARTARAIGLGADLVVPVPLHWLKSRLRGTHTPAALAHRVARQLQLPCAPRALRRVRWTATQTQLTRRQRQRNVAGAFQAQAALVRHRRILLIDDVLTSTATVQACSLALRHAGAAAVTVLAAARTPASHP